MRRIFLIFGVLISLSSNPSYCYTFSVYEPPESTVGNYTSYPKITKLERIILHKTFENEDIESRLTRLEEKTFKKVFTGSDLAWRVENITNKIDKSELYNIPSKELASIEKRILGRSFKKDDVELRLSRLEQQILGATQSGNIDERYQTILSASTHYTNFNNNLSNPITTFSGTGVSPTGGIKNAFRNVFHTITGVGSVTGYTPPISPYGFNTPYGFNPNYGTFGPRDFFNGHRCPCHSPRIGHRYPIRNNYSPQQINRYYNYNNSYNSGLGVHILD